MSTSIASKTLIDISSQLANNTQLKNVHYQEEAGLLSLSAEERTALLALLQQEALINDLLTETDTSPIEVLWYPTST